MIRRQLDRMRRPNRQPVEWTVVWLDGSRDPDGPIRRRRRLLVFGWIVLSVPLRTVEWSR